MPQRVFFVFLFTCFTLNIFCQYRPILPVTKDDYLLISKREKRAAWIMFGAGSAMLLTAFATGTDKDSPYGHAERAVVLGAFGVFSATASIPLFILSAKNKKRAAHK